VVIDGQFTLEVDPSEKLLFYRSDKPAKFFKFGGEFYQKVRETL
jgi:NAD kinase